MSARHPQVIKPPSLKELSVCTHLGACRAGWGQWGWWSLLASLLVCGTCSPVGAAGRWSCSWCPWCRGPQAPNRRTAVAEPRSWRRVVPHPLRRLGCLPSSSEGLQYPLPPQTVLASPEVSEGWLRKKKRKKKKKGKCLKTIQFYCFCVEKFAFSVTWGEWL